LLRLFVGGTALAVQRYPQTLLKVAQIPAREDRALNISGAPG
jgi:hypothetical protein